MTGAYDEMSERSYAAYPGGTSLQRWDRTLLRNALESEGFAVYLYEWWHFDYKDWQQYPILNLTFEQLSHPATNGHGSLLREELPLWFQMIEMGAL
jgi:D-alanyl-D-alanine dipeptidase